MRLTLLAWELMGILTLLGMNILLLTLINIISIISIKRMKKEKMLIKLPLSEMNIEASKSAAEVLKSSTPKGNDDQKGREDQSRMKEHVRSTHL